MRRALLAASIALLLVLAGCSGLGDAGGDTETPGSDTAAPADTATRTADGATGDGTASGTDDGERTTAAGTTRDGDLSDPESDVLGWEDGYWYDEPLRIDRSDGLNDSELDAVAARMMARVEEIRRLEFTGDVSIEVISREQYEENNVFSREYGAWYETYYEAAFLVDEDTSVTEEFRTLYGSSVAGYYSPSGEAIVLVSDDPDAVRLDPTTLAHELVHALQDDALPRTPRPTDLDDATATTAVTEGDANYVMDRYVERCAAEWDCLADDAAEPGDRPDLNVGLYATVWVPYSDGPTLIDAAYERGGWDAVNDLYTDPPASTEQVIHPEAYPDERPVDVTIADRSTAEWEQIETFGRTQGTFGEATLFATLWDNGVIDEDHVRTDERRFNYSHPYTEGWGGDAVVGYSNGAASGYVFASVWDSAADAREFREAYVALLESKGAVEVRDGVYRVPEESGYGDAFRVSLSGDRLVVVNAPDVATLDEIRSEN